MADALARNLRHADGDAPIERAPDVESKEVAGVDQEVSADALRLHRNGHVDGNGSRPVANGAPYPDRLARLYGEQLVDIRSAEQQALDVFPDMAVVATDETVASVFRAAASESEVQLARLARLMKELRLSPDDLATPALDGFRTEARTILDGEFGGNGRDLDEKLLRSARRSLRYQIAGYESVCSTARRLGDYRTLDILLRSLDEELATDSALSQIIARRSRMLRAI